MAHPVRSALAGAARLLVPFAAGLGFYALHLPLAWLLGPLLATAAMTLSGHSMPVSTKARRVGQIVIGISIGLHVTGAVIVSILPWIPVMIGAALLSIVIAAILSVVYARLARIDAVSAYYAMLPGGLSEMANVGLSEGARPEPITIGQTLRVSLVVLTLPPLIFAFGIDGNELTANASIVPWWTIPILIAIGALGVTLTRRLGIDNSWMTGSLIAVGLVSALGWPAGQIIPMVLWVAQFLIGINIGARFEREQIVRLPRVALYGAVMVLTMTACSALIAAVLALSSGVDFATLALAVAPGGIAEMAATAQALHLSLVLITGFHLTRALIVNGFAKRLRLLLEGTGILSRFGAVLERMFGPDESRK